VQVTEQDTARPWLAHYSSWVPAGLARPAASMIDRFEASARRRPESAAICYFDRTITFATLDDYAMRFATLLAEWHVGSGDRVALYLQNVPQFVIALIGAWKRGAIVVPLNPMFKQQELAFHLEDSGATVMVCLEALYESCARDVVAASPVKHVVTTNEIDLLPDTVRLPVPRSAEGKPDTTDQVRLKPDTTDGVSPILAESRKRRFPETTDLMDALAARPPDALARCAVGPDEVCLLGYTSGTTGQPKGAMTTHANVAYNADVYRVWMNLGDDDRVLGVAPLFHITGMVAHIAVAILVGIPLVLSYRFDPAVTFQMIDRWRPTMTVGAITAFLALMHHPDAGRHDLSSLTRCYSGGAPIPPSAIDAFESAFGVYIHNIYGLTESTSPTHAVPLGTRAPVDPESGALSVGVPVPGCEIRLLDLADPSRLAAPGAPGELAVRGPMIVSGYWNRPELAAQAFRDGYFLTGDVVMMDEQGFFYVLDRKKDLIIVSGFKVWPRDVEDTLYQHPGVREAAVVGVPDAYRGETVKAFVSLREGFRDSVTEQELIDFCKARIAAYKYPRVVELVDEVPKTVTGKFLRRMLRDRHPDVKQ
jgi:long-chain acyl-CoA synthetase